MELNKIITGDCTAVLKDFEVASIDAVITDIPYGIGYEDWDVLHNNTNSAYGGSSAGQTKGGVLFKRRGKPLNGWSDADRERSKEYQSWCQSWAEECYRVLKPGASCLIFAGRRFAPRCVVALEDLGFTFKDMLSWEKDRAAHRAQRLSAIYERRGDERNAEKWRGWRVANTRPIFEPILWFQKPYRIGGTIADNVLEYGVGAWNQEAFDHFCPNSEKRKQYSNSIAFGAEKSDSGLHPTQKPLKLMEFLVELVVPEEGIVLDPFCGSGTTCLAAQRLNRQFIGIECDELMVQVAANRIESESSVLTLF